MFDGTRSHVLKLARSYQAALLLQQASALGLPEELHRGVLTAESLAERRGWRVAPTHAMLEALQDMEIAERRGGGWGLTAAARCLLPAALDSVSAMLRHEWLQQPLWMDPLAVLREGHELQQTYTLAGDVQRMETLLAAMTQIGRDLVDDVLSLPVLREASLIVDAGGGSGVVLAEIAKRYPRARGCVMDLPLAERIAKRTFNEMEVSDRLNFVGRDVTAGDPFFDIEADCILLIRVIHQWGKSVLQRIFSSARSALPPGGIIVVAAADMTDDGRPAANSSFGAYMAVNMVEGWQPPRSWVSRALRNAGFAVDEIEARELSRIWIGRVS